MKRLLSAIAIAAALDIGCATTATAADIRIEPCTANCSMYGGSISIEGEIKRGDLQQLYDGYKRREHDAPWAIAINSPGGDLQEAMSIGLWVRTMELVVSVPKTAECASPCVFILAAGVGRFPSGNIIIHRPYFAQTPNGPIEQAMRDLLVNAREYLAKMNIPEGLADAMFAISPSESRTLSESGLTKYMLNQEDYTYTEARDLEDARRLNLNRVEHLQRKQRMDRSGDMKRECAALLDTGELLGCALIVRSRYGLLVPDKR